MVKTKEKTIITHPNNQKFDESFLKSAQLLFPNLSYYFGIIGTYSKLITSESRILTHKVNQLKVRIDRLAKQILLFYLSRGCRLQLWLLRFWNSSSINSMHLKKEEPIN